MVFSLEMFRYKTDTPTDITPLLKVAPKIDLSNETEIGLFELNDARFEFFDPSLNIYNEIKDGNIKFRLFNHASGVFYTFFVDSYELDRFTNLLTVKAIDLTKTITSSTKGFFFSYNEQRRLLKTRLQFEFNAIGYTLSLPALTDSYIHILNIDKSVTDSDIPFKNWFKDVLKMDALSFFVENDTAFIYRQKPVTAGATAIDIHDVKSAVELPDLNTYGADVTVSAFGDYDEQFSHKGGSPSAKIEIGEFAWYLYYPVTAKKPFVSTSSFAPALAEKYNGIVRRRNETRGFKITLGTLKYKLTPWYITPFNGSAYRIKKATLDFAKNESVLTLIGV